MAKLISAFVIGNAKSGNLIMPPIYDQFIFIFQKSAGPNHEHSHTTYFLERNKNRHTVLCVSSLESAPHLVNSGEHHNIGYIENLQKYPVLTITHRISIPLSRNKARDRLSYDKT